MNHLVKDWDMMCAVKWSKDKFVERRGSECIFFPLSRSLSLSSSLSQCLSRSRPPP